MSTHPPHPSFFALDVARVEDQPPSDCHACRAHEERLQARATLPASLEARLRPRAWHWGWSSGGVALAAGLALWLIVPSRTPEIRTKGSPSVSVYLRRGPDVHRWLPGEKIRSGDSLRLRVLPSGYRFVTVLAADGTPLFQGALPSDQPFLLPQSLRVDGASTTAERLRVILSHTSPSGTGAWSVDLVLPKETQP